MKFKNTFLSLVRHTLTTVGGVLIANPDPRYSAIGAGLVAIGGLWGAGDENKAENNGKATGIPVSLIAFALVGVASAFTFTGCASAPGGTAATPAQLEARAYALVNTAGIIIADDKPELAAEIARIADGVDAVFANGTLKPEQIAAFLGALDVPADKRALIAAGVNNAYQLYKAETGRDLVEVSNPTAAAILRGVKRGITDAVALTQALQSAAK